MTYDQWKDSTDCMPDMPEDWEILDWIDPDWRDHFIDTDDAAKFYRKYSAAEWRNAIKELQ